MIKIFELGIERNYLNIIKAIYNGERESFFSKTRDKTRTLKFTISIQCSTRISRQGNQAIKRNKRHCNWKGRYKIISVCK